MSESVKEWDSRFGPQVTAVRARNSQSSRTSLLLGTTSSTMGDNGSDTHQPGAGADSGGCEHYRRKCDVLAPCCGRYFCCHLCHDEHFASNYADGDACSVEMKVTYHQAGAATHCSLSTPIPSIVQQPPHSRYAPHRPRQTSKISPQERCNALKVIWRAGPAR
eukprot:COSAG02_NODE_7135_length_3164_cov_16.656444_1_plen_163_part_00